MKRQRSARGAAALTTSAVGQASLALKGLVVASHGRHCVVESADGSRRICHPRGKKNAPVVGDEVLWLPATADSASGEGSIETVLPRRNLLYRQDEVRSKSFAANIDQVLILLAAQPMFSQSQLARALVACTHAGVTAIVALNKSDLAEPFALAWQRLQPYARLPAIGADAPAGGGGPSRLPVLPLCLAPAAGVMGAGMASASATADGGLAALCTLLHGRRTLVLGPSGSGKSTLVNLLAPHAGATTGEISRVLNSGRHTTTATTLYWLDGQQRSTALLDSPGFQEFGLRHISGAHLPACMPDIAAHAAHCRFYNCTHLHEPGCAVRAAVDAQTGAQDGSYEAVAGDGPAPIHPDRYRLYAQLRAELDQPPLY